MPHRFAGPTALVFLSIVLIACSDDGPTTGDRKPPTVLSVSPTSGATAVTRTSAISATLSERVDPGTVDATTFIVTTTIGASIAGTLSVDGSVITFTPTTPLAHGTSYVVQLLDRITDLAGNTTEGATWGFTVEPNPAPFVVSSIPAAGAQGVDGTQPLTVTFSEPITATTGSFLVLNRGPVSGTMTIDGATLTFTPAARLAMNAVHGVELFRPDIRDLDGATLAGTFAWTFRTAVDSAPEHVDRRVTLGVAVTGEWLEAAGDIDDFFIHGTAGAEWVVFIRTNPQRMYGTQIVLVDSLTGTLVNSTVTPASYPALEDWSLGRVVLPRTGTYLVRVTDGGPDDGPSDYAFRVDAINRAPESAPATFALGAVISESIGTVADVDEFSFQGTAGQEVDVFLQLVAGMSGGLTLDLVHNGEGIRRLETSTVTSSLDALRTGRITLPSTGTYTIRVSGPFRGASVTKTGDYRFQVANVETTPENGATVRLDGPPITGAIDHNGDIDEYAFTGSAGQLVMLHLADAGLEIGEAAAHLIAPDGTRLSAAVTDGFLDGAGIEYSRRVTLPQTGTYRLRVESILEHVVTRGAYALEAYTVSAAPEHVPATIALGQVVTGEQIDRPGDIDVFTFRGEAGRDASLFLTWPPTDTEVLYAYFKRELGWVTRPGPPTLDGLSTGRFALKDSTYTVTVDPHWSVQRDMTHSAGPYAFRVFPIDRSPEGRPASYLFGDTVSAEVLHPSGDIDQYSFELTGTTTLEVFWDAPSAYLIETVAGFLYPAGNHDIALHTIVDSENAVVRTITLPAGRYDLVVLNPHASVPTDLFDPRPATQRYRFAITRKAPW